MTVFSALAEKIAARIPDQSLAQELLAEAAKADPMKRQQQTISAEVAGLDAKGAASMQLMELSNNIFELNDALQKMKVALTLTSTTQEDETAEQWWDAPTIAVTAELLQGETRLMSFKVTPVEAGGYYVEAEENSGGGGFNLSMMQNAPAADMAAVEEMLAKHLDASFRIPADQAAPVLKRLIETVDFRPEIFLHLIKEAPFEQVLDFVKAGINAGHVYQEYPGKFLPLDWVLMSRDAPVDDKNKIAPFTREQRRELFEAVAAQAKDPSVLVSDMTMRQAASHNAYDLLPRLLELGAVVRDEHFAGAGGYSDNAAALKMLQALRPYISDVNAENYNGSAGRAAAYRADLETFKWLETQGLDKDRTTDNNHKSYAHALVGSALRKDIKAKGGDDGWPQMLQYLIDGAYDFQSAGPAGTPVQMAVENGNLDLAKILIEGGAAPDASLMVKLLTPVFYNTGVSADQAKEFMTYLHEQHAVPYAQEVADAPMNLMRATATYNFFNAQFEGMKPLAEIADFLKSQGAKPAETPEVAAFRTDAAEKLRGAAPEIVQAFGIEALPVLPRPSRLRRAPTP